MTVPPLPVPRTALPLWRRAGVPRPLPTLWPALGWALAVVDVVARDEDEDDEEAGLPQQRATACDLPLPGHPCALLTADGLPLLPLAPARQPPDLATLPFRDVLPDRPAADVATEPRAAQALESQVPPPALVVLRRRARGERLRGAVGVLQGRIAGAGKSGVAGQTAVPAAPLYASAGAVAAVAGLVLR